MNFQIADLDKTLFLLLNQDWRHPLLDRFIPLLSSSGYWLGLLGLILLGGVIWGSPRFRWMVIVAVVVLATGDLLTTYVLKPFFARPRPYTVLDNVWVYKGYHWLTSDRIARETTLSFPSNHAVNSAAFAMVVGWFFRRWWPWMAIMVFIVGYSRIYMGLHYPLDVFTGIVVGVDVACLVLWAVQAGARRWPRRFPGFLPEGQK